MLTDAPVRPLTPSAETRPNPLRFLRDIAESLRFVYHQAGWRALLRVSLWPLYEYHRAYVWHCWIREQHHVPRPRAGVTIRLATVDDLPLFATVMPAFRVRRFERKLRAGEQCILAVRDGEVLTYIWAAFAHSETARNTPLRMEPTDFYLWGVYASTKYPIEAMHALMTGIMILVIGLREQGYTRLMLMTGEDKIPVEKLSRKLGCYAAFRLRSLRLLRWRIARFTPDEPRPHAQELWAPAQVQG